MPLVAGHEVVSAGRVGALQKLVVDIKPGGSGDRKQEDSALESVPLHQGLFIAGPLPFRAASAPEAASDFQFRGF
jgi:hypothetical protein